VKQDQLPVAFSDDGLHRLAHFLKRDKLRIWIGEPTLYLRHLFIGQRETAFVLRFHFGKHPRGLFLALWRPIEHPVEDFFYLVSGHCLDIA